MRKVFGVMLVGLSMSLYAQYNFEISQKILEYKFDHWSRMAVSKMDMFVGNEYRDEIQVLHRSESGIWEYTQTLTPSDKFGDDEEPWNFGALMAIDGKNAIIGASRKVQSDVNSGGVYFYRKDDSGVWREEFIFDNPFIGSFNSCIGYGGSAISISGNKATVSHSMVNPMFVHIIERQLTGEWLLTDTISDPEFLHAGGGVYFDGNTFITMVSKINNQRVKEYTLLSNGDWKNTDTLDCGITNQDTYFGGNLSLKNNKMVIGAFELDVTMNNATYPKAGSAFLYEKENNSWMLKQTFASTTPTNFDFFGIGVDMSDELMVVSGGKFATVYAEVGNAWIPVDTIYFDDGIFSRRVKILGNQLLFSTYNGVHVYDNTFTTNTSNSQDEQILHNAYPNPFDSELEIEIPPNSEASIVDVYGNKFKDHLQSGVINTSDLKSGMYFLVINVDGRKEVKKIVKQ